MRVDRCPKISVIVPAYNASRTLRQCLEALNVQTDSNYEIIIVDDCSTDNSPEICKEFGFKALRLAANKGQAVARNRGAKEASGEIIAFVDSDAVVLPDWVEKYRQLLRRYADADMVCSGYSVNHGDTEPALFAFYEIAFRRQNIPLYISSSTSSNCVIYRKTFEEVGGYPEYYLNAGKDVAGQKAVATAEDAELGFLLNRSGRKIVWSHDNPVMHYFRKSWKGYLKQQMGFARFAVLSVFKFPERIHHKHIYSNEKTTPQLMLAAVMHLGLLGIFFGQKGIWITVLIEGASLFVLYIMHERFMRYLKRNMKGHLFIRMFFWLVTSRLCWLYGVLWGVRDGFYMRWNDFLIERAKR